MTDQLKKSNPQTCVDSPNATFSPELECGATPSVGSQDCLTTLPSGLEVAPANPSVLLENSKDMTTLEVVSGKTSSDSSLSVALQRSLENRSQRRLSLAGSTISRRIWVTPATKLGLRYSLLVMLEHPTKEKGCTLWQTPMASPPRGNVGLQEMAFSLTSGRAPYLSDSQTGKGVLYPELACWLMGLPMEWLLCGVSAMLSLRNKRRSSYSPSSKRGAK